MGAAEKTAKLARIRTGVVLVVDANVPLSASVQFAKFPSSTNRRQATEFFVDTELIVAST